MSCPEKSLTDVELVMQSGDVEDFFCRCSTLSNSIDMTGLQSAYRKDQN